MELFRGYVPTRNKQCLEKFKGVEKLKTRSEVQDLDEYAGILGEETILIDVDDAETSELLFRIVQDLELKCRVYATTRGKHFLFKNCGVKKSWTKCTLAVGITTDGKVGANNSYEILKSGGVERPILYDFPEGEIQELPKWLTPVKSNYDFPNLGEGDGRNQTLFNYILTLQSDDFTKEEARECIRLINRYVLKKPLSDKELDVILRDDAFQKQAFFKGTKFLHDKFATYLKNDCHIIKINGQLHTYQDGVYRSGIEAINRAMVKILPGIKKAQRSEVIDYLNIICDERQPEPPTRTAFKVTGHGSTVEVDTLQGNGAIINGYGHKGTIGGEIFSGLKHNHIASVDSVQGKAIIRSGHAEISVQSKFFHFDTSFQFSIRFSTGTFRALAILPTVAGRAF